MNSAEDAGSRVAPREGRPLPAYGPIDALLGFVLLYVAVDRATPIVADVHDAALPGVRGSTVGLGLAAVFWFVLAVTVVDQVRR